MKSLIGVESSEQQTHVLYHRDADGFASAFAAWCALGNQGVIYTSVQYGEAIPPIAAGSRVFIVDFSYPRRDLEILHARCPELIVLDHHKSAAAELEGLEYCTFDMSKSGCELAWEYFRNFTPADDAVGHHLLGGSLPWPLAAVADRDLWKFELPNTAEICAALDLYAWEFETWLGFVAMVEGGIDNNAFVGMGITCIRQMKMIVKMQAARAVEGFVAGHKTMMANVSAWSSETCHELLQRNPDLPFVLTWYDKGVRRIVSLRSRPDGFDVSQLAAKFKGGGHPQAAGFTLFVEHAFIP